MEDITKPSITRLARCAGVKSLSEDCFPLIRTLINNKLDEIINTSLVVNSEHQTKTLMSEHIYNAFNISNINITQSNDLGTSTCTK